MNSYKIAVYYRFLTVLRLMGFVPTYFMYILTVDAFGTVVSACLSIGLGVLFFNIVSMERIRAIREGVESVVKEKLLELGQKNFKVEGILRPKGVLARVYLMDDNVHSAVVTKGLALYIEKTHISPYVWAIQVTKVKGDEQVDVARRKFEQSLK